jgi:3'-5' exoribonuclease
MSRRFINQLGERESIDQVFAVGDKQLRANRQGNLYLHLRLVDKTGWITGMLWNATESIAEGFQAGDYVNVEGTTQLFNGALQVIVTHVSRVPVAKVDEEDFVTIGQSAIDDLQKRLIEMLRGIRNLHLRNLIECFLTDERFMAQFSAAPAGIKNHHAYKSGLLEHVVSLMETCAVVGPRYKDVDTDLLLLGAFLHDAGKIEELAYERELAYTDVGQLIGHLVIAVGLVDEKIREAEKLSGEDFPEELALRIKHMIVSHHGEYEYGSPKLPMTPEAITLHFLDSLDAKLHSVGQLLREDVSADDSWTTYQPSLGRKIFKGQG